MSHLFAQIGVHLGFQESLENQFDWLLVHEFDERFAIEFTASDSVGEELFDLKGQCQKSTYTFVAGEEHKIGGALRAVTQHLHCESSECKIVLLVEYATEAVADNLREEVVSEPEVRVVESDVVGEHESLHQSSQHILVGHFERGLTFEEFACHRRPIAQLLTDA